ncbi:hypothetical protein ABEW19_30175 [Paenibacillus illinoisensis]
MIFRAVPYITIPEYVPSYHGCENGNRPSKIRAAQFLHAQQIEYNLDALAASVISHANLALIKNKRIWRSSFKRGRLQLRNVLIAYLKSGMLLIGHMIHVRHFIVITVAIFS